MSKEYIDSYLIPKKAWVRIVGVSVTKKGVQPLVKVNGRVGVYSGDRIDAVIGYIMQEAKVDMLYANNVSTPLSNKLNNLFLDVGASGLRLKIHRFYSIKVLRNKRVETHFSMHKSCL